MSVLVVKKWFLNARKSVLSKKWSSALSLPRLSANTLARESHYSRRVSQYIHTIDSQSMKPAVTVEEYQLQTVIVYSTPFHQAVKSGDFRKVKALVKEIEDGMNFSSVPTLPFQTDRIIKALVENRDRFDSERTSLLQAAAKGYTSIMKYLVQNCGADVFAKDCEHESLAIHLACQNGHLETVRFLLDWNPHLLEAVDKYKCSPLHTAALSGNLRIVRLLVEEKGADIEMRCQSDGSTPLLQAASKGHVEVVKFLVEKGADLSARAANSGMADTAVHLAAAYGHCEVVDYLLTCCPSLITVENEIGLNPYGYAMLANQWPVARLVEAKNNRFQHENNHHNDGH